jgi:hypothetical protein
MCSTLVPAIRSPSRALSSEVIIKITPKMFKAGSPSTILSIFRIKLLTRPGFPPPTPLTRSPTIFFPNVAPTSPSSRIKYKTITPRKARQRGSVINRPSFQRWSAALIIQTPLTKRVTGKKTAQNNKKSMNRAKNRGHRPAKRTPSFFNRVWSRFRKSSVGVDRQDTFEELLYPHGRSRSCGTSISQPYLV